MIHRDMLSLVNFPRETVVMQRFPNLLKKNAKNMKINICSV